jgi:hypothetical protein
MNTGWKVWLAFLASLACAMVEPVSARQQQLQNPKGAPLGVRGP